MGSAMAMNLLKAGHNLTVYNRTAEKAKPLLDQGARAAADPAEATRADVVFTMLADDGAVETVSFGESGILAHLHPGSVHISSSTISVDLSQKLIECIQDRHSIRPRARTLHYRETLMPLFTVTMKSGRAANEKNAISRAIHQAIVSAGYPDDDMFQRFFCLGQDDLKVDLNYPGLPKPRRRRC
jgi:hypothetical protein